MDLLDLISAYALTSGAIHPYGHVAEGYRQDVPMRVDYKAGVEKWSRRPDNKQAAQIHGAGFEAQDRIKNAIEDPEAKGNMALANAIYKAMYLSGIPDKLAKGMRPGGDIGGMEKTSGNKHIKELIAASMISDIMQANNPVRPWDLRFQVMDGAPGLMFDYKW